MPRTRLLPTLALTACATALAGAAAPTAHADSISYIKDGNVYLATPDGSRTAQVTSSGGYSSASQADDGRIVALKGSRLHVMNRWGDVLADFSPVGAGTAGSITLNGPYDPAFSPDGTTIAFGFYVQYKTGDPNCGKPGGCQQGQLFTGVGYTRADGPTEWSEAGYRPQYSWTDPSWIDNQHVLMAAPTSGFVKQTAIDTAGDGQEAAAWFSEGSVGNLYDGEMTRQRSAAAFVGNTQGDKLLVYRTPDAPPADPKPCLDAPAQGGKWSSPSWSPDGTQLAWAGPNGIYVATLGTMAEACPAAGSIKVTAFEAGAASPDWGPADLPGAKPQAPGGGSQLPGGSAGGATSGGTGGSAGGSNGGAVTLTARTTSRRTVLRKGLKVQVRCATGQLSLTAKLGKTTLATGRVACTGTAKDVTLALTRSGRARLKSTRRATVEVRAMGATPLTIRLR